MDHEEFRAHAHTFADWMADYLTHVEHLPVRSQVKPGEVLNQLPARCPEESESMDAIFADFKSTIMPGITHWQHPKFFAYFTANSSPPSVLAEMLTATLGAQCMLWETSPAATELEARVTEWLRTMMDLPAEFIGSIQDSASAATLCAIIAACNRATAGRFARAGLAGGPPLIVYASAEAHSSVEKGARIAGVGADNVVKIATRDDDGMDPQALRDAIRADRAAGRVPACIVTCFGTTGVGACDPLEEIGRIAKAEDIHLHVDAAWAGSALIVPAVRAQLAGIERADSLVFNPHKWLFTNFDCSLFYMRDPGALTGALSLTPTYLESKNSKQAPEYRDWSVALGRRFRALKLWFVLRSYGAEGLRQKIREHLAWTEQLADLIRAAPGFELTTPVRFAMLSFRYAPDPSADEARLNALNERLLRQLNDSGQLYLTKTSHRGRVVIRFVVGQTYTTWRHVRDGWEQIQASAATLESQVA